LGVAPQAGREKLEHRGEMRSEDVMAHISIIGSGNMGQALAGLAAKGGNTVETMNSSDTDRAVTGDIVVLAVPYASIATIVAERGAQLAGKVVVDITNPVNFETFDGLTVPADGSAAAGLAAALPDSRVVKAFNTNFAGTLASGAVGGQATTVLIAGDDADAKALLAGVVSAAGLRAIDAGGLSRARELEAIGFLQITLAAAEKISWTGGFAVAE
jgi:predicted dinucleotide-binding enzyme